jgi:trk system potassium uptake protein TrkA
MDANRAQAVSDLLAHVAVADATDRDALETLGLRDTDCAVVSLGRLLEASVMATLHCVELGVACIYAKVTSPTHGRILERIGASRVIFPERDVAQRLAQQLAMRNLVDYLPIGQGYSVDQIQTPERFVGKRLSDLKLPKRYRVQVVAVRDSSDPDSPLHLPNRDTVLGKGEHLVLIGRNEDLTALEEFE